MSIGNIYTALDLLKTRLNRPVSDTALDDYLLPRLNAADAELARAGIHLNTDSADDLIFLVDYAAWQYGNRDKPGGMPDWLRLARRERWLAEHGGGTTT
jgi:hypothetical protein